MRHVSILLLAALALAGCQKTTDIPSENSTETTTEAVSIVEDYTLTKKCSDGTNIYQIEGGIYATWDGSNWVKLSPGIMPDQYCS
jgi:hypothetical protein